MCHTAEHLHYQICSHYIFTIPSILLNLEANVLAELNQSVNNK